MAILEHWNVVLELGQESFLIFRCHHADKSIAQRPKIRPSLGALVDDSLMRMTPWPRFGLDSRSVML
jgi:hypothetical protein